MPGQTKSFVSKLKISEMKTNHLLTKGEIFRVMCFNISFENTQTKNKHFNYMDFTTLSLQELTKTTGLKLLLVLIN